MANHPVTLQFLGAAGTVTGSKYLLEIGPRRILIDAGLYQGEKHLRQRNWDKFPIDATSIEAVVLTHAHADHVSYLPALVKQGFDGPVHCTEATARLAEIVLRDAAHLQEQATQDAIRGGYSKHAQPRPLYTTEDAERAIELLSPVPFDENIHLGDGLWAQWTRAGHILGSASVRMEYGLVDVLFSGDLGRDDHPLLRPRETPEGARWVLCESTYGDREHTDPDPPHQVLVDAVNGTIERGGAVLIPAFAIDRTQTVMYTLAQLQLQDRIPDVPVIIDGPMSMRALDVYRDMPEEFRDEVKVEDFTRITNFVEARSSRDSQRALNRREPRIIVSSSGMLEGGRVLNHLMQLLPDARNCVVLSGYQGEGTRGRALLNGAKHLKIKGRHIKVEAEVVSDREFSAHAGASELVSWVAELDPRPEMVYLVHGEEGPATALEERLERELGIDAVVPRYGEKILLSDVVGVSDVPTDEELGLDS